MNVIKEIERINDEELKLGIYGGLNKGSWHDKYKDSAWVFLGGFSYELSEGDIICVMSQWGEIEDINLIREKSTNKSMGFAFIKYEDFRSTILAVDNFNGIKLLGRSLRCDHVDKYKLPKEIREKEEELLEANPEATVEIGPGHAYKDKDLENEFTVTKGVNIWGSQPTESAQKTSTSEKKEKSKKDKAKKQKKKDDTNRHKEKKQKKSKESGDSDDEFSNRNTIVPTAATTTISSSIPLNPIVQTDEAPICSWRGIRDPNVVIVNKPLISTNITEKDKTTTGPKKDELTGMGGMKRIR
mmetsp:Transcript_12302/g.18458  ORF Transcript_12302/g.18458 Transcript_12302/m.18458 type:complete len:299 (-) Transcript_12302:753-1649(-)